MRTSPAGDTRARIQQVALELFTEQGYEQTSLREIAERLGVTKAALYYHFRTKEDIARSTIADYMGEIDTLIDWGKSQPRATETRRELIRRYAALCVERRPQLMFFQQNPVLREQEIGHQFKDRFQQLIRLMAEQDDPVQARIRGALALIGLNASMLFMDEPGAPEPEVIVAAAIEVALDLVDR